MLLMLAGNDTKLGYGISESEMKSCSLILCTKTSNYWPPFLLGTLLL
jgi:hypothetical protein